jgi:hypothetical protein
MPEDNNEYELKYMVAFKKLIAPLDAKLDALDSKINIPQGRTSLKYYRNDDLKKIFGLSNNTIIKYRLTGVLPYTKLGDIFLYDAAKIEKILKDSQT